RISLCRQDAGDKGSMQARGAGGLIASGAVSARKLAEGFNGETGMLRNDWAVDKPDFYIGIAASALHQRFQFDQLQRADCVPAKALFPCRSPPSDRFVVPRTIKTANLRRMASRETIARRGLMMRIDALVVYFALNRTQMELLKCHSRQSAALR